MPDSMNGAFFTDTWPTGHTSDLDDPERNDFGAAVSAGGGIIACVSKERRQRRDEGVLRQ
ncbi:protein of unknown function [Nitrospira defluvii]|jgi:hypothetical protein|uniref:Uncharacterized protein n=1 Tax=Nitrospira defluvii TaxID=330214 RepID=D8P7G5_9BACT|nr:protein of unknown function [Nitrospira defluvii]